MDNLLSQGMELLTFKFIKHSRKASDVFIPGANNNNNNKIWLFHCTDDEM